MCGERLLRVSWKMQLTICKINILVALPESQVAITVIQVYILYMLNVGSNSSMVDETDPLLPRTAQRTTLSASNPHSPISPLVHRCSGRRQSSCEGLLSTSVWDATYREALTGELCVSEIVVYILLFLECHLPSLNSAALVSQGWRSRTEYLPQWRILANMIREPPMSPARRIVVETLWQNIQTMTRTQDTQTPRDGPMSRTIFMRWVRQDAAVRHSPTNRYLLFLLSLCEEKIYKAIFFFHHPISSYILDLRVLSDFYNASKMPQTASSAKCAVCTRLSFRRPVTDR